MRIGAFYRVVRLVFGALMLLGGLLFISQWIGLLAYHPPNIWAFFWVAIGIVLIASAFSKSRMEHGSSSSRRFVGSGNFAVLEAMISVINLIGGISLIWLSTFLGEGWGLIAETNLRTALHRMPLAMTFTGLNIIAPSKLFFVVMALFLLSLSILGFMTLWGILTDKRWALSAALVLLAINLPLGFFFLSSDFGALTSIFMNAAAMYYLIRALKRRRTSYY